MKAFVCVLALFASASAGILGGYGGGIATVGGGSDELRLLQLLGEGAGPAYVSGGAAHLIGGGGLLGSGVLGGGSVRIIQESGPAVRYIQEAPAHQTIRVIQEAAPVHEVKTVRVIQEAAPEPVQTIRVIQETSHAAAPAPAEHHAAAPAPEASEISGAAASVGGYNYNGPAKAVRRYKLVH